MKRGRRANLTFLAVASRVFAGEQLFLRDVTNLDRYPRAVAVPPRGPVPASPPARVRSTIPGGVRRAWSANWCERQQPLAHRRLRKTSSPICRFLPPTWLQETVVESDGPARDD